MISRIFFLSVIEVQEWAEVELLLSQLIELRDVRHQFLERDGGSEATIQAVIRQCAHGPPCKICSGGTYGWILYISVPATSGAAEPFYGCGAGLGGAALG